MKLVYFSSMGMQIISKNKTVKSKTEQGLKRFNSQSSATKAKKGEQLDSMMLAVKKTFDILGADIVEFSTENKYLNN